MKINKAHKDKSHRNKAKREKTKKEGEQWLGQYLDEADAYGAVSDFVLSQLFYIRCC
jgi:hypothetical protein